jgi:hypothetical protein
VDLAASAGVVSLLSLDELAEDLLDDHWTARTANRAATVSNSSNLLKRQFAKRPGGTRRPGNSGGQFQHGFVQWVRRGGEGLAN